MRVYILALQEQISVAEKLLEDIGNAKIISRPLLDEVTKEISTNFKKNIRNADVILVIIDEKFANNITLNTELQIALMECKRNKNKLLLPIILDDAAVPTALESMIYIKCNLKSQADIEKTKLKIMRAMEHRRYNIRTLNWKENKSRTSSMIILTIAIEICVADIEVEYPSGERLDESRVITEQSFDVELNDWGEVQFVSYLPTYETLWEDVSFVLAKDNQIIYYFPECYENNSTENDSVGMFDSVEAVGFQDIDGDGAKDVIVIINYVTGAGPQGMMPRKTIRIFSSQDNGLVIQHDLMDELMENMKEDDISIPAICDYVTLMEINEIYDGYRTIYQQYFADEVQLINVNS